MEVLIRRVYEGDRVAYGFNPTIDNSRYDITKAMKKVRKLVKKNKDSRAEIQLLIDSNDKMKAVIC